ncbi:hypothetical protein F5050DRAFT_1803053 [Lentinula boryana]|uniref:Uncharacterized protein n=1 Tax=Lentinula boryana TaxID=40481 RepID=A0ABQ8QT19_9AGAR|nr:hypothetical protein F5050DRAFT_1803053 [Lentinula boryana]
MLFVDFDLRQCLLPLSSSHKSGGRVALSSACLKAAILGLIPHLFLLISHIQFDSLARGFFLQFFIIDINSGHIQSEYTLAHHPRTGRPLWKKNGKFISAATVPAEILATVSPQSPPTPPPLIDGAMSDPATGSAASPENPADQASSNLSAAGCCGSTT